MDLMTITPRNTVTKRKLINIILVILTVEMIINLHTSAPIENLILTMEIIALVTANPILIRNIMPRTIEIHILMGTLLRIMFPLPKGIIAIEILIHMSQYLMITNLHLPTLMKLAMMDHLTMDTTIVTSILHMNMFLRAIRDLLTMDMIATELLIHMDLNTLLRVTKDLLTMDMIATELLIHMGINMLQRVTKDLHTMVMMATDLPIPMDMSNIRTFTPMGTTFTNDQLTKNSSLLTL